jgi:fatty-acyl-CoA synthase
VATLALNTFRHLECFYGISGMGAILHTVNPRLFPEQIAYIINHAENRVLLFDPCLSPLVESVASQLTTIAKFVVLADHGTMPDSGPRSTLCYEDLIDNSPDDFQWPLFDERTAASLCYTSGTTGRPKGVLYSHRSTLLHALAMLQPDCFGLRAVDVVLPFVPMFHVHAWSTPYVCPMVGAKLVLPGHQLDASSLVELLRSERVTFALGVPTVWSSLIDDLRKTGQRFHALQRVLIGGSALPPAIQKILAEDFGVHGVHAWGMTETSPIGAVSSTTAEIEQMPIEDRNAELLKQGRPPWGVEIKIVDPNGELVPRDGESSGMLWIRGPWVASSYFKREQEDVLNSNGWFPTGDIAAWDRHGFVKITDRTKDVIKSGGEWISSIDIENIAMLHPKVRFAAAIAAYHPKWDERPILIIVPAEGESLSSEETLEFLRPHLPKWWLPDAVVFVRELPMTATGKIMKAKLRSDYRNYLHQAS